MVLARGQRTVQEIARLAVLARTRLVPEVLHRVPHNLRQRVFAPSEIALLVLVARLVLQLEVRDDLGELLSLVLEKPVVLVGLSLLLVVLVAGFILKVFVVVGVVVVLVVVVVDHHGGESAVVVVIVVRVVVVVVR